jgi:hypothetical protein
VYTCASYSPAMTASLSLLPNLLLARADRHVLEGDHLELHLLGVDVRDSGFSKNLISSAIYIEALTPWASMFHAPPAQCVMAVTRTDCERMGCPWEVNLPEPLQHIQISLFSNARARPLPAFDSFTNRILQHLNVNSVVLIGWWIPSGVSGRHASAIRCCASITGFRGKCVPVHRFDTLLSPSLPHQVGTLGHSPATCLVGVK